MSAQQITDIVLAIFSALTAYFAARGHASNAAKLDALKENHADTAAKVAVLENRDA